MLKRVADEGQLTSVISILKPNYERCLYLYCNVLKYGFENENFEVFFDEKAKTVVGVYFKESVHVYSPNEIGADVMNFISERDPRTIFSSVDIDLSDGYEREVSGVYVLNKKIYTENESMRTLSSRNDIKALTDFLYEHSETYRVTYTKETLEEQMMERLSDGYSRYSGIFQDERLIGCVFTKAETADIMIVGGMLVSPDFRGKGIGRKLCLYEGAIATKENKKAYCLIDEKNQASIKLNTGAGYEKTCKVFKYTKIKNN